MQRHRSVGIGARVEHQTCDFSLRVQTHGLMNPIHQLAFVVALAKQQWQPHAGASLFAQLLHIGQSGVTIDFRLTGAQQIQIRTIENKNSAHIRPMAKIKQL